MLNDVLKLNLYHPFFTLHCYFTPIEFYSPIKDQLGLAICSASKNLVHYDKVNCIENSKS